ERAAGDPRSRHGENGPGCPRVSEHQSRPEDQSVDVQPARGDVLPEDAVTQLPAELALPPVQLLAGEEIDRLAVPAVVPLVTDVVPDDAAAQPTHLRTGRPDGQRADGILVDPVVPVGAL